MDPAATCPTCGAVLSRPDGPCPACLLRLARGSVSGVATAASQPGGPVLPSPSELSASFPQLEIQHLIGRGGMGAVYRARQKSLDRTVALKIIAPQVASDPAFAERFAREARTLAKLSHPHIVGVYDFGHTSGGYFLLMEYVDGVTLRQAISAQAVEPNRALQIVGQICDALQYAHEQGVVHRDIKPENILLDARGAVKIADFGLAKLLAPSPHDVSLTGTRHVLGTAHYIAPEQVEQPEAVDARADIYSLGVVFYELLTGHLPLGRFALPSEERPDLDRRIDPVVLKTLERRPQQRYQQASELRSDLQQLSSSDLPVTGGASPTPWPAASNSANPFEAWQGAATPVTTPSGRLPSVPFTTEALGGFAEAVGLLHFDGGSLHLEWQVRDGMFQAVKGKAKNLTIPLDQLLSIQLHPNWWGRGIQISTRTLSILEDVPNAVGSKVKLTIDKSDLPAAKRLVESVQTELMQQGLADPASAAAFRPASKNTQILAALPPHKQPLAAEPYVPAGESSAEPSSDGLTMAGLAVAGLGAIAMVISLVLIPLIGQNAPYKPMAFTLMGPFVLLAALQVIAGILAVNRLARPFVMGIAFLGTLPTTLLWPLSGIACGYLLSRVLKPAGRREFEARSALGIMPFNPLKYAWLVPVIGLVGFGIYRKLPNHFMMVYKDPAPSLTELNQPSFRDPFVRRLAHLDDTRFSLSEGGLQIRTENRHSNRIKQLLRFRGPVFIHVPQTEQRIVLEASDVERTDVDGDDELEIRLSNSGIEKVLKAIDGQADRTLMVEVDDQPFGQWIVDDDLKGWQLIKNVQDAPTLETLIKTPPLPIKVDTY